MTGLTDIVIIIIINILFFLPVIDRFCRSGIKPVAHLSLLLLLGLNAQPSLTYCIVSSGIDGIRIDHRGLPSQVLPRHT